MSGSSLPQNMDEAKDIGEKALTGFPVIFRGLWQNAKSVCGEIWQRVKGFWFRYVDPLIINLKERIKSFLTREVEKRKPAAEEEFEKEKQEFKQEIPDIGRNFWQRIKDLVK